MLPLKGWSSLRTLNIVVTDGRLEYVPGSSTQFLRRSAGKATSHRLATLMRASALHAWQTRFVVPVAANVQIFCACSWESDQSRSPMHHNMSPPSFQCVIKMHRCCHVTSKKLLNINPSNAKISVSLASFSHTAVRFRPVLLAAAVLSPQITRCVLYDTFLSLYFFLFFTFLPFFLTFFFTLSVVISFHLSVYALRIFLPFDLFFSTPILPPCLPFTSRKQLLTVVHQYSGTLFSYSLKEAGAS